MKKLLQCACFAFDFGFGDCKFLRAEVVCHYAIVLTVDNRVESAAHGSFSVSCAGNFLCVVEYAVAFLVPQLGISFLVHIHKLLSWASCFLEKSDVSFRQLHLSVLAADSTARTMHAGIVVVTILI
jgi:hypothetical protein